MLWKEAIGNVWKQKDDIEQCYLSMSADTENSNVENDVDDKTVSAQSNENSEQVLFRGFDSLYESMVALEDQILCMKQARNMRR